MDILDDKNLKDKLNKINDIDKTCLKLLEVVIDLGNKDMLSNAKYDNYNNLFVEVSELKFKGGLKDDYGLTSNPKKIKITEISGLKHALEKKDFSLLKYQTSKSILDEIWINSPEKRLGMMKLFSNLIIRSLAPYEGLIDEEVVNNAKYIAQALNKQ